MACFSSRGCSSRRLPGLTVLVALLVAAASGCADDGLPGPDSLAQQAPNLVVNGSFELGYLPNTGWRASATGIVIAPEITLWETADTANNSVGALRVTIPDSADGVRRQNNTGALISVAPPLVAGTTLDVSFYAKSVSGGNLVSITPPGASSSSRVRISNTWSLYRTQVTVGQTATGLIFSLVPADVAATQPVQRGAYLLDDIVVRVSGGGPGGSGTECAGRTTCVGGDGCCPAVCGPENDGDCPPRSPCEPGDPTCSPGPGTPPVTSTTGGTTSTLADAPVVLDASLDHQTRSAQSARKDSERPVTFRIPRRLMPEEGFAGNGTARLTFRSGGSTVTCDYRGGSRSQYPSTDLDFARGQTYVFERCSNSARAGDVVTGDGFELSVGGGDVRFGKTTISLQLGPGCGGMLDPPLWPEEVVALRQSFSWSSTTELPTTDARGLPALRYAMLYIEDHVQIEGLKKAGIYFRQRPLFEVELARYEGQCGELGTPSDDRGTFVYALLPAVVYNRLRSEALNTSSGRPAPFRAIILPSIPDPAAQNPDGTVSWEALKESRLDYFDRTSTQQPLFGIFDDIVEAVGDLVEGVVDGVTSAIGAVDRAIAGTVRIRLDFTTLNRDPAFLASSLPMQRAWGPGRGKKLVPHGMEVELIARTGPLPESFWGKIGLDGTLDIKVAKNSKVRGSGMCVHLENDAAMLSRGVTEREMCNFEGLRGVFNGFQSDIPRHEFTISTRYFNYMAQLTDGFDYTNDVMKRRPRQAEVLIGSWANIIGGANGNRAFVGCLNFADVGLTATSFVTLLATAAGAIIGGIAGPPGAAVGGAIGAGLSALATLVAGPVILKDIFLPTGDTNWSRGIVTHEYGHFVMCDGYNQSGNLVGLYGDRLSEGFAENGTEETAIVMEAFADLFASQVVGGTNYVRTGSGATISLGNMSYCVFPGCLELNFRGLNEAPVHATRPLYNDRLRRLMTTYYDAFDLPYFAGPASPHNADLWLSAPAPGTIGRIGPPPQGPMTLSMLGFMQDGDDAVSLPGTAMQSWLRRGNHRIVGAQADLANTMYENGVSWCSACVLFGQHDPGTASTPLFRPLWEACTQGELRQIVGPPPEPFLNLDANTCKPCPASHFSNNGTCTACLDPMAVVVENQCRICPPGSAPSLNQCFLCGENQVSNNGRCANCALGGKANRATNTCESCPASVVIDYATRFAPQCDIVQFENIASSDPACPFVIELRNVDAVARVAQPFTELNVQTFTHRNAGSPNACRTSGVNLHSALEVSTLDNTNTRRETTMAFSGAPCTVQPCRTDCAHSGTVWTVAPAELQSSRAKTMRVLIDTNLLRGNITNVAVSTGSCPPD